ncbi:MAG: tetratricopeptide repeat protein [Bacteroidales bacterium]|nr:tetratricopeptide repeat protein [Bacteroidales bacterium]
MILNRKSCYASVLLVLFLLFSCQHNRQDDRYADMPSELAEIYKKIDKNPSDLSLYFSLSDYYMKISLQDSALNAILTALRIDSTNTTCYLKLSDVYFAMNHIDASEEMLEKVISMDGKNQEAYLKLAELHFLHKRYDKAQNFLQTALSIDSYNPKAYFIWAWVYKEEGDTMSAIRSYLTAIEQDIDYFEAYEELAILYHHKKDPIAANYYKNALNIKPDDILLMYNFAMFYQEMNDFDKAIMYYKMILQINPSYKYALHNIAWIYMIEMERYEDAIAFFTNAIDIDNEYIEAIYNRGLAFESLKQYDNARQDYAYTLKLNDKYELGIEGLNRLDRLQSK